MKRLILDKLRRERGYTWNALEEATEIPFRTLQDIGKRGYMQDISQIGTGTKKRLLKVAEAWSIDYEELFEPVDDSHLPECDIDEYDDLEEIIADMQQFITESGDDVPETAKEFSEQLNQSPFIYTGNFDATSAKFLSSTYTELNNLKKEIIIDFVVRCRQLGKDQIISSFAAKLTDSRFKAKIRVLKDIAIAFHQNSYKEESSALFEEATRRLARLMDK